MNEKMDWENPMHGGSRKPKKRLVDNKLFLMGMSVLVGFSMWVAISFSDTTTEVARRIEGVPLVYENLPDSVTEMGLDVIEQSITVREVDVTIYGKQYIVSQVSADDLRAEVKYRDVSGAGTYMGEVHVTRNSTRWDFRVSAVSVENVSVRLDRMISKNFAVEYETNIYQAADGYMLRQPKLSDTTVTITGTGEDISKIYRVVAKARVPSIINATATYTADIVLEDKDGNELKNLAVQLSTEETDLTIAALLVKQVPVRVEYRNEPGNISGLVNLSATTIEIAVPSDMENEITELVVGTIDFSTVDPDNYEFEFSIAAALPSGCVNQSSESVIKASVRVANMSVRHFEVSNIVVRNTTGANATVVSKSVYLSVVGMGSQLDLLTENDMFVTVNVSDYKDSYGKHELAAEATILTGGRCWVYGEPTVLVQISPTRMTAEPIVS
jgi:YbbR domain-containing protein